MERRSKFWIMPDVQKGYLLNMIMFWLTTTVLALVSLVLLLLYIQSQGVADQQWILDIWDYFKSKGELVFIFFGIHFFISLFFGFLFFRIFTLRICGPIYHVQNYLKALNAKPGSSNGADEVRIRKSDYFQSLTKELNEVLKRAGVVKN